MSANPHARRVEMIRLLQGTGIEIGAMHEPVPAPHLHVRYVDRLREETLRLHYQELSDKKFVPLDIVDDGQTLTSLADGSQDFVIANHVIEHLEDPIRGLATWNRVLRPGGRLFMAVPDKERTFDRARPLTTIEHLVLDHEQPSAERDYEAFREFAIEVSAKVLGVVPLEGAEGLAKLMFEHRYSIHYHVWDQRTFRAFLDFVAGYLRDYSLVIIDHAETMGEEFIYVLEKR